VSPETVIRGGATALVAGGRPRWGGARAPYNRSLSATRTATEIVGRDRELEAVGRLLDRVKDGPAALVLEGEAGIGKTTIWLEGIRVAEARSFRILETRPVEAESELSYVSLADLVSGPFIGFRSGLPPLQEHALADGAPFGRCR
jgi:AAA ATPase domain